MERFSIKIVEDALKTLDEILKQPYSIIVRDATIQRFEYTFEAFWRFVKNYLYHYEGIRCNSPKSCFKEIFNIGIITEDQTVKCLEMTDDRNLTSHTYNKGVADSIYIKIKNYFQLMSDIFNLIKTKVQE